MKIDIFIESLQDKIEAAFKPCGMI